MPRARLPHLHRQISRHGRTVWYVRIGHGRRIRLAAVYGSPEFLIEYQAALVDAATARFSSLLRPGGARQTSRARAATGTMAWLVARWRDSSDWLRTAPATRKQREAILRHILEAAGEKPIRAITSAVILAGRERRKTTPFAANNFLKTLRGLFRWAKEAGLVETDPAAPVRMLSGRTAGFKPWTADDVTRFRTRWPLGTRERLALELLLWTGLRRGDAVRLGRQHVRDNIIAIATEKTGITVYIPVLPPLAEAIAAGPTGDLAFLATATGAPMAKESFGNWFGKACKTAGVEASAHGLRKLASTDYAESGATEEELQAALGWTTVGQSRTYTRSADRKRLALQAARKRMMNNEIPSPFDPRCPPPLKNNDNFGHVVGGTESHNRGRIKRLRLPHPGRHPVERIGGIGEAPSPSKRRLTP